MDVGRKIEILRKSRGLSQAEIGEIAGVSSQSVSYWEAGEKSPRLAAVRKICERFGLDLNEFADESLEFNPEAGQGLTWKQRLLIEKIQGLSDSQVDAILTLLDLQSTKRDPGAR